MRGQAPFILGIFLAVIGLLMTVFNRWKVWRSRWFSMGGMVGARTTDEKTALMGTRFWGVITFVAGVIFVLSYFKRR